MNNNKPTQQDYDKWSKDPNNWIWGIFYYNKLDDRIFPPKRIQWMGYTTNFANPYSVLVLLSILAIIPIALMSK